MRNIWMATLIFGAVALLSACATDGNNLGSFIQNMSDKANAKTEPTVVTPGIAAGRNVAVIGYRLAFEEIISKSSASRYGGANMTTQLKNIGNEDFDRITEAAYTDFKEKLKLAGFTMIDQDKVNATPKLKSASAQKQNEAAPERNAGAEFLVGRNFLGLADHTRFLSPKGLKPLVYRTDSSVAGFAAIDDKIGDIASEIKDTTVAVNLGVGFAKMGGSSIGFSSSVSSKAQISIDPDTGALFLPATKASSCTAFCSMSVDKVRMGVLKSETGFGDVVDDTSTAQRAGQVAGLAANVALGGFGVGASVEKSVAVMADPKLYEETTLALLKEANSRIVMEIAQKTK